MDGRCPAARINPEADMAKKRKRTVKKSATSTPAPVVVDPFGPTSQRPIKKENVKTSSYKLSDGTVITVKPKVSDIRRAMNQWNALGQPLYFLTLGYEIKTNPPSKLLKKMPKKA